MEEKRICIILTQDEYDLLEDSRQSQGVRPLRGDWARFLLLRGLAEYSNANFELFSKTFEDSMGTVFTVVNLLQDRLDND